MTRKFRIAGTALAVALLAGCVPRPSPPPPEQPEAREPVVEPAPPPPPPIAWQDAALSPGDWSYRREGGNSAAAFGAGAPAFIVSCEPGGRIALSRVGGAAQGPMTVRTSYGDRNLPATLRQDGRAALVAMVASSDPLLDRMVFSRGRFAVGAPGLPLLVLPAWPEPARVVEECRG